MGSHHKPGSQGFWHLESPFRSPRWTGLSLRRLLTLPMLEKQQLLLPADATSCCRPGFWKNPSRRKDEKLKLVSGHHLPKPLLTGVSLLIACLPVVFFHFCNRMWHQWVHFHNLKYPISAFISIFKWAWKHNCVQIVVLWSSKHRSTHLDFYSILWCVHASGKKDNEMTRCISTAGFWWVFFWGGGIVACLNCRNLPWKAIFRNFHGAQWSQHWPSRWCLCSPW